ncbi:GNAT family N-acetyltransferase [Candidatus Microgenomates bacterium]|nr:GNAT family N-acetyltransferase [Candidatus Microgenomates bacterium]
MDYQIRPATRKELDIPIEWATKEGWNPGLYDVDAFYKTDPNGFFLGFLDGEPIASISAVAYDDKFGFLGFYIVKPEYRAKGYGIQVWNEALKHLPSQNIGLDGVVAQQDNYKKSGFKLVCRNIRYEGVGVKQTENNLEMVLLKDVPFEQFKSYDDQVFPASRSVFLQSWIKQPESLAIGFVKDGKLLGYSMVRKCRTGFKVGLLFANTKDIANALFQRMRSFVGKNSPIFLDVPKVNKDAVALAETYQMKPMFETARMYTKEEPNVLLHKVFGVTTFELG